MTTPLSPETGPRFRDEETGSNAWLSAVADLINGAGEPSFPDRFAELIDHLVLINHCAVFAYGATHVEHIFSAGRVAAATAQMLATDYAKWFHQDPLYQSMERGGAPSGTALHGVAFTGNYPRGYRQRFFSRPGLIDKLSIRAGDDARAILCNLYRAEGQGLFSAHDKACVERVAPLLGALVTAHAKAVSGGWGKPGAGKMSVRDFVHGALASGGPPFDRLTQREREVCERIMVGYTSEAIALDLHVSLSSVLTYRRRAYERLQISSQHDLFALCFEAMGH